MNRIRVLSAACFLILLIAESATACPVCYGDPNNPMVKSTNSGIWFLLGVVGFLWIGFAALFFSFWMRSREIRRRREGFHVIHGGAL